MFGIDLDSLEHETNDLVFPGITPGRTVHIDADFLAYSCSAQGKDDQKTFEDMKHNAEVRVETIRQLAGAEFVHLHLTPSTSTKGDRHSIALLKGYQLNRVGKEHPQYLNIMRVHLAERYPGTLHSLCEADDGMSSEQYAAIKRGDKSLSIIASKDKDLSMVPGLHLDWDTGVITNSDDHGGDYGSIWIDRSKSSPKCIGVGQKLFWAQMLMGDSADNISGLPAHWRGKKLKPKKIGPVYAVELLDGIGSNKEAFQRVRALYADYGTNVGFTHYKDSSPVSWQQAFVSEATLLWMRRTKEDAKCVLGWLKEINV